MKLDELNPTVALFPKLGSGVYELEIDCPRCKRRMSIFIAEREPVHPVWKFTGDLNNWNSLTVSPSVNLDNFNHGKKGPQQCWHGHITNGEITGS